MLSESDPHARPDGSAFNERDYKKYEKKFSDEIFYGLYYANTTIPKDFPIRSGGCTTRAPAAMRARDGDFTNARVLALFTVDDAITGEAPMMLEPLNMAVRSTMSLRATIPAPTRMKTVISMRWCVIEPIWMPTGGETRPDVVSD